MLCTLTVSSSVIHYNVRQYTTMSESVKALNNYSLTNYKTHGKRFICCLLFVIVFPHTFKLKLNRRLGLGCGSKFTPCRIAVSILLSTDTATAMLTPPWSENLCSCRQTEALRFLRSDRALAFRVNFYSCTSDLVRTLTDRTHEAIKSYSQSTQFF